MQQNAETPVAITDEFTSEDWDIIFALKNEATEQGVALIKKALQNSRHVSLREFEQVCGTTEKDGINSFVIVLCKTFNNLKENAGRIKEIVNNGENIILRAEIQEPQAPAATPAKPKKEIKPMPSKTELKGNKPGPRQPDLARLKLLSDIAKKAAENANSLKPETAKQPASRGAGISAIEEKEEDNPDGEKNPFLKIEPAETKSAGSRLSEEKIAVEQIIGLLAEAPHTAMSLSIKTGNPRKTTVEILRALVDLGYVSTELPNARKSSAETAERLYKLTATKHDIPSEIDKLVKIAGLIRKNLYVTRGNTRNISNISKEIIGAKKEMVISVICRMADNGFISFASDNPRDVESFGMETDKTAAIAEGKYQELAIKLNFTNASGG